MCDLYNMWLDSGREKGKKEESRWEGRKRFLIVITIKAKYEENK